jgi:hypothetical protein
MHAVQPAANYLLSIYLSQQGLFSLLLCTRPFRTQPASHSNMSQIPPTTTTSGRRPSPGHVCSPSSSSNPSPGETLPPKTASQQYSHVSLPPMKPATAYPPSPYNQHPNIPPGKPNPKQPTQANSLQANPPTSRAARAAATAHHPLRAKQDIPLSPLCLVALPSQPSPNPSHAPTLARLLARLLACLRSPTTPPSIIPFLSLSLPPSSLNQPNPFFHGLAQRQRKRVTGDNIATGTTKMKMKKGTKNENEK